MVDGTIKNIDDAWALLKTEGGQARYQLSSVAVAKMGLCRFEGYLGAWMKEIEDLLNESEQIRVETDESGPQVRRRLNTAMSVCTRFRPVRMKLNTGSRGPPSSPCSRSR